MSDTLVWGSITICDSGKGDIYSRITYNPPKSLDAVDVLFPNTAGRELRVSGNQSSAQTAYSVAYGNAPGLSSVIYRATEASIHSLIYGTTNSISARMTGASTMIGTLTERLGAWPGMRLVSFVPGTPRGITTASGEKYMCQFEARFEQYDVP